MPGTYDGAVKAVKVRPEDHFVEMGKAGGTFKGDKGFKVLGSKAASAAGSKGAAKRWAAYRKRMDSLSKTDL